MNELHEQLAAIQHDIWSHWQKYFHSKLERGCYLDPNYKYNLEKQIRTPYTELSEREKASDREQVDKFWPLIEPLTDEIIELRSYIDSLLRRHSEYDAEINDLRSLINNPITNDFIEGVTVEIPHQENRWGTDHDAGKDPSDWFWLVGYLSGKALFSAMAGDVEKARHHIITAAAALGNWFKSLENDSNMKPGGKNIPPAS